MLYDAPRIDLNAIPAPEKEPAQFIQIALDKLGERVVEFKQCLSLARHCQSLSETHEANGPSLEEMMSAPAELSSRYRVLREEHNDRRSELMAWLRISMKQGAMVANEYWETTQSINKHLGLCPELRANIDMTERKKGSALFTDRFPLITLVRISAAHSG